MNDFSKLTRQTLYQSVWAQPMTKVAAGLGISDVALRKICVKHNVPVPVYRILGEKGRRKDRDAGTAPSDKRLGTR